MEHNTRHLADRSIRNSSCLCSMCNDRPNSRRFAKRRVRRAVRHSERSEIARSLADENNRDGDGAYVIHVSRLSLDNVRALRTLHDGPPWEV